MAVRSDALRLEVAAMARIEAAFGAVDELPEAAVRRVRRWAHENFASPEVSDLADAVRKAAAGGDGALHDAAIALADAVDGSHAK